MRVAFPMLLLASLTACGSSSEEYSGSEAEYEEEFGEERGGETYSEYDDRRDSYEGSRGSYAGYDCTDDCSGHDAGYNWAEENGIDDPDNCGGNSWSFEEGCRAYAEENGY
jgi:hypothetical protein